MKVRRALVVYKKSAYQIYVLERRSPLFVGPDKRALPWDLQRLRRAHQAHQETLAEVHASSRPTASRAGCSTGRHSTTVRHTTW